jgi:serine/threonine-protein kinase
MHEPPPPQLIALLGQLGLAAPAQIRKAEKYVRRLARDLPRFESVWIDALAQARLLSPFQAAEINAGRGVLLRLGPYLLCRPLADSAWVRCYRARHVGSGQTVRLAVADAAAETIGPRLSRLEALVAMAERMPTEHLLPIRNAGQEGGRLWAASPWIGGRTAAQWLVHQGRFPADVVLEIARAMTAGLAALEELGLCHGDVAAQSLLLTDRGGIVLLQPGLRGIVRPEEGYAQADLPPEAYDYLPPERIAAGTPPDRAGDVYACGCVWWHLLCGRPPLAGGESLAKLRTAEAGRIADVRRLAPEAPAALAETIAQCVCREPHQRPQSMTQLADLLGRPSRTARQVLSRNLGRFRIPQEPAPDQQVAQKVSQRLALAALTLMAIVAAAWPFWQRHGNRTAGPSPRPAAASPSPSRSAPRKVEARGASPGKTGPAAAGVIPMASRGPPDLVLDGTTVLETVALQPGQCVRAPPGHRPTVAVPPGGLIVAMDRVRFENIDFVWRQPAIAAAAMVRLRAGHGEFQGCTFQAAGAAARPSAIAWTHPADAAAAALALPSGQLRLSGCVFRDVGVAIDCRAVGAVDVDMSNTLHLGTGAVLRLDHRPGVDEPVAIRISRVTLRDTGPLLQVGAVGQDDRPRATAAEQAPAGEISVEADGCVLAPAGAQPLLLFAGPSVPARTLAAMRWSGQGSLVLPDTPIAAWRRGDGSQQVLDEAAVSMAGLVRSAVDFAGHAKNGIRASRVLHWRAPLQSPDPPGVDVNALPTHE